MLLNSFRFAAAAGGSWSFDAVKGQNRTLGTSNVVSLSGITAGQKLFAVCSVRGVNDITTPSGWVRETSFAPENTAGTLVILYSKTAAGGESSVTFAEATTQFIQITSTVFAMSGSGQKGPTAGTTYSFSTSGIAASVTVIAGSYRLCIFAADQGDLTITAPAGGTVITTASPASVPRDGHMLWIEGPLSAGAAGAKTATYNTAQYYNSSSVALEPV